MTTTSTPIRTTPLAISTKNVKLAKGHYQPIINLSPNRTATAKNRLPSKNDILHVINNIPIRSNLWAILAKMIVE